MKKTLLMAFAIMIILSAKGQQDFKTYWIGNSYGTQHKWVQNFIEDMGMGNIFDGNPDNDVVYTASYWDEGGQRYGIYKDCDVVGNQNMGVNSKVTTDQTGKTWEIVNFYGRFFRDNPGPVPTGGNAPFVRCSDGREIWSIADPTAIFVDQDNKLYIADNGPDQNIKIFNISGTPSLIGTYGDQGGIFSGQKGVLEPKKFLGIVGVGRGDDGKMYVANGGFPRMQSGTDLRTIDPQGNMTCQKLGLFVNNADFDPTVSDGSVLYTALAKYTIDYNQPAHDAWQKSSYTADPFSYPEDIRMYAATESVFMREMDGQKFMFVTNMYASFLAVYRFEGEVAIPSLVFTVSWRGQDDHWNNWGLGKRPTWNQDSEPSKRWVWRDNNGDGQVQSNEFEVYDIGYPFLSGIEIDKNTGDIYFSSRKMKKFSFMGIDNNGVPIYNVANSSITDLPGGELDVTRVVKEGNDMYFGRYPDGQANAQMPMFNKIQKINNYGQPNQSIGFTIDLPFNKPCNDASCIEESTIPISFTVEGDYIFVVWVTRGLHHGQFPGRGTGEVTVYNKHTGQLVRYLYPGSEVGNWSGWIDLPYAINAKRLANGKYLIAVEEDGKGKVLIYEWQPDCTESAPSAPSNLSASAVSATQIDLSWSDNSNNEDGFKIERKTGSGGSWAQIATVSSNTTSYQNTGLTESTTYYYRVRASNCGGDSGYSNEANATTQSEEPVDVTGIHLEQTALSVGTGQTATITANIEPSNATNQVVHWSSNDQAIATVDQNGNVTGVQEGTAIITATTDQFGYTAQCTVTVTAVTHHTIRLEVISGWNYVNSFRYLNDQGNWITAAYDSPEISHNFIIHGGGWLESETAGNFAEFTFTGTAIQLVAKTVSWGGTGRIYLNGVLQSPDVSFQGPDQNDVVIFEETDLGGGAVQYSITINTSGEGTVNKSPDKANYDDGEQVTLTANPASGYEFAGWSGDVTGTDNPVNIIMNSNKTVTATFDPLPTYTLAINAQNGSVDKSPDKANYDQGEQVTLTATANSGYQFTNWSGDASGTNNPITITMDSNKEVTANFDALPTYTLTINAQNGSVDKSPDKANYDQGEQVTLTATANSGYQFTNWSGDVSGSDNPITITMDSNKDVTANFSESTIATHTIRLEVISGWNYVNSFRYLNDGIWTTVAYNSPEISHNFIVHGGGWLESQTADHFAEFTFTGTAIQLVAKTVSWGGTGRIYLNGVLQSPDVSFQGPDQNDVVIFEETDLGGGAVQYSITINTNGEGNVNKSPDKANYDDGEQVTLTANPASGYEFAGWSGDASGTDNPITITMNSNKTVTATFDQLPSYTLTVNAQNGSVDKSPDKVNYDQGEQVTLTATANSGYQFTNWSGDASGTNNPITITMDANKSVTANFSEITSSTHTIKLEVISGWNYVNSFRYLNDGNWITVPYSSSEISHNFLVHGGGWLESQTAGNYAELTFDGTAIQLIAKRLSWGGTGRIYIDGILQTPDVSFYNSTSQEDVVIFEKTDLLSQYSSEAITSVTQSQTNEVLVYPNPLASGKLTIELPMESNYVITMTSISGQVVYQTAITDNRHLINQNILAKGIYVLTVQSNQLTRNIKVIVE